MTNSPYYDPKLLLLEHDLDKELIQQTLELFEFVCGDSDFSVPEDKELKQMFLDTINKYKDSESISIEAIKERIAEQGYLYITEIFNVTEERLRILASYLPLIQILKGTKPGLELIFTILNVGFEIKEWWEDPTNLEILSYILFVELINQPVSTSVVPRLKKFSREYVYPLLTQIVYAITYKLNKTPYIGAAYYSRTALTVWQEFLWLKWAGDSAPENLWTDQAPYQEPPSHKSYWQGQVSDELEWNPTDGPTEEVNTWSSIKDRDHYRIWKLAESDMPEDGDLLEWWIEKINLFGKPEESWCTEDKNEEDPIITYWSPDTASDADGTLVKLTIVANPSYALVEINGELAFSANVKKGEPVSYRVYDPNGLYLAQSGTITPLQDMTYPVNLVEMVPEYTLTLQVLPSTAKVEIFENPLGDLEESVTEEPPIDDVAKIITYKARKNTKLYWRVSAQNYIAQQGELILSGNIEQAITLDKVQYCTFTINPSPENAIVKINLENTNSVTVKAGTKITWSVSADGYSSKSGELIIGTDQELDVSLEKLPIFTINPSPENAIVTINGEEKRSVAAPVGTSLVWSVSSEGYTSQSGVATMKDSDSVLDINLVALNYTITINSNINANISLISSGGAIGMTQNSITTPYGSTVTYTVDPTVDSWSESKSGSVVVTKNETINVNFTESTQDTSFCSVSSSNKNVAYIGASLSKIYTDSSSDTWVSGKYAAIGPCTVKVTVSGSVSGYRSPRIMGISAVAFYGTSETMMKSTTIASWIEDAVDSSSPTSKSTSGTLELAEGEKLFYLNANLTGTTTSSSMSAPAEYTTNIKLKGSYSRIIYV